MDTDVAGVLADRLLAAWMRDNGRDGWAATERLLADLERAPLVPEHRIDRLVSTHAVRMKSADRVAFELTKREKEVLTLLAEGDKMPVIAEILGIAVSTVQYHVKRLRARLGAKTAAEAVSIAVRRGLI